MSIQIPRNSAFLCEKFLYLVRKKRSLALPGSIVTAYEFGAIKVQLQFYILADSSPPFYLVTFIPFSKLFKQKTINQ